MPELQAGQSCMLETFLWQCTKLMNLLNGDQGNLVHYRNLTETFPGILKSNKTSKPEIG